MHACIMCMCVCVVCVNVWVCALCMCVYSDYMTGGSIRRCMHACICVCVCYEGACRQCISP